MAEWILRARRFDTSGLVEVLLRDGHVQAVRSAATPAQEQGATFEKGRHNVLEAEYLAPGFWDIQVNGALGHNFTSRELTPDAVRAVCEACLRHGTTHFCPTVITSDAETISFALRALTRAIDDDALVREMVLGFHLEGPYICPDPGPRGAHPAEHVRPPDWEEFSRWQEAAQGRIRVVTLAPTWPQAIQFIARLSERGVVVALGHHNAGSDQIKSAVRAGARLCTHLGNGCDLFLPRHPNYLWDQLAEDALWASIICDGHHLPGSVIKCIVRCKTPSRCLLISDASPLAGLPAGEYSLWGKRVTLHENGRTETVDERGQRLLAGAACFLDTGVARAWRDTDLALAQAVELASLQPRRLLSQATDDFLQPGARADFVLFDVGEDRLRIRYTILGEQVVRGEI
ncbi:MAG: amidohydrolase family protein [Gemmatales bacterium]|nr:amidohydrolase family protein [Gemmatales bacterium]MDW7993340.1 amidohydrolase family protein [Gemmatales bacterium]